MSKRFPQSNEHLLHLLWFNVVGRHLGVSCIVATPSTRSFYTPSHARGTGGRAGGCRGSVVGLQAGFQTQRQQGLLSYTLPPLSLISNLPFSFLFHPLYLPFTVSQLNLSLFCPWNQRPRKTHFKRNSSRAIKTRCVSSFASPRPAETAGPSLWGDASSEEPQAKAH